MVGQWITLFERLVATGAVAFGAHEHARRALYRLDDVKIVSMRATYFGPALWYQSHQPSLRGLAQLKALGVPITFHHLRERLKALTLCFCSHEMDFELAATLARDVPRTCTSLQYFELVHEGRSEFWDALDDALATTQTAVETQPQQQQPPPPPRTSEISIVRHKDAQRVVAAAETMLEKNRVLAYFRVRAYWRVASLPHLARPSLPIPSRATARVQYVGVSQRRQMLALYGPTGCAYPLAHLCDGGRASLATGFVG